MRQFIDSNIQLTYTVIDAINFQVFFVLIDLGFLAFYAEFQLRVF